MISSAGPAIILATLLALPQSQNTPDLAVVVQRATEYVTQYEQALGNLIGTEEYIQNSSWMGKDTLGNLRVSKRLRQRLSSDFLIIQVGSEWSAARKVNKVDGIKVPDEEPSFDILFDDSPQGNSNRLAKIKADSTRYNLGDIIREINLPTFALRALRKGEVSRFAFLRAGTAKIDGTQTWTVRFHEQTSPTLVVGNNGVSLYSSGTFWIDPDTGRVLRTEFTVENPYAISRVRGTINVRYSEGKNVKMLLPSMMDERYESEYNNVECQAFYSNFRPFEVDVKFEIHPPAQ